MSCSATTSRASASARPSWRTRTTPPRGRQAIRPETRVLFAESIPNPKNDILDIARGRRRRTPPRHPARHRQHARYPVPSSPDRARRRHRRPLRQQVPRRSRHRPRRRHRRRRPVRLGRRTGPLPPPRDRTRLRWAHFRGAVGARRVPGLRPLGHRTAAGALSIALQRVLHPARHRDAVTAHPAALRLRTADRALARGARRSRVRRLQRTPIQPVPLTRAALPPARSGLGLLVHAPAAAGMRRRHSPTRCSCSPA